MTLVALTMRVTEAVGYSEPRDSISHDWLELMNLWGMTPLLIPNIGARACDYITAQRPDILVLTGGEDIGRSPVRDATETALLDMALKSALPVFGVCRGLQFINRYFGGKLATVKGHVAKPHKIIMSSDWTPYYGAEQTVNSYHNIGIDNDGLADALIATARDSSGNIEAAAHRTHPLCAVMWHPERQNGARGDKKLFQSLMSQQLRHPT